jgi:hypothetical protein
MKMHANPVPDFKQLTADFSVYYSALVTNYQVERDHALKNKENEADNEELR